MPGFDGTGPLGQGPMTGRGMGYCVLRISDGGASPRPLGQNVPARSERETDTSGETGKELERCHKVTEQAPRKVAGVGVDAGEWVDRLPQDRPEVASVRVVGTESPMPPGSPAIRRLARSAEQQ